MSSVEDDQKEAALLAFKRALQELKFSFNNKQNLLSKLENAEQRISTAQEQVMHTREELIRTYPELCMPLKELLRDPYEVGDGSRARKK